MTETEEVRALAGQANAWPFEEARRIVARRQRTLTGFPGIRIASAATAVVIAVVIAVDGCVSKALPPGEALSQQERRDAIRRASVWSPTQIPSVDFRTGPKVEGAFAPNQWVTCDYKEKEMSGTSPKFTCETSPGKEIKVKYGSSNAEIFGEVLASRLFWGLGFAADRMFRDRKPFAV